MHPISADDIARIPLFSAVERDFLESIARNAKRLPCQARDRIVEEGDQAGALFLIAAGYFKAVTISEGGKETLLSIMGPGEVFGELSILDGQTRSATVTALQVGALVIIEQRQLLDLLHSSPVLAIQLLKGLCLRVRDLTRRCGELGSMAVPGRLAQAILRLAELHGHSEGQLVKIPVRISQQDLGALAGATRESVNKQIGAWQIARILCVEDGYLVLNDLAALRLLVLDDQLEREPRAVRQSGGARDKLPNRK